MKALKVLMIVLVAYAGVVVAFESLIGWFQPSSEATLVITTFDEDGARHDRVVSRLESDGHLYVAANHWPRAWYHRALENPDVRATVDGEERAYRAVPVDGAERARVEGEHGLPFVFRILTGFPPREIVRLDPRPA
jgi:hypothetical protein